MFEVVQMQSFTENWYGAPPAKIEIYAVPYAADKIIRSITALLLQMGWHIYNRFVNQEVAQHLKLPNSNKYVSKKYLLM